MFFFYADSSCTSRHDILRSPPHPLWTKQLWKVEYLEKKSTSSRELKGELIKFLCLYIKRHPTVNLTQQMECCQNAMDLFHVSIQKDKKHKKNLEINGTFKKTCKLIGQALCLSEHTNHKLHCKLNTYQTPSWVKRKNLSPWEVFSAILSPFN